MKFIIKTICRPLRLYNHLLNAWRMYIAYGNLPDLNLHFENYVVKNNYMVLKGDDYLHDIKFKTCVVLDHLTKADNLILPLTPPPSHN